ncbi:hypothetical protein OSG_eHP7_00150 [environmental Halophage eHP-7]|nr:hypothetical protein OSG_eHP7_00150 [environmental Halophage eHP-7]
MERKPPPTGNWIIDLLAWPVWMLFVAVSQWGVQAASVAADVAVAAGALAGLVLTVLRIFEVLGGGKDDEPTD